MTIITHKHTHTNTHKYLSSKWGFLNSVFYSSLVNWMSKEILLVDRCSEVECMFSARYDIPSNRTSLIEEPRQYNSYWSQEIWLQNIMRMGSLYSFSHSRYTLCHEDRLILWHFQLLLPSLSQAWSIRILMSNKLWPQNPTLLCRILFFWTGKVLMSIGKSHWSQNCKPGRSGILADYISR